jgi:DNA-binding FrmR family transcriptional regulator
MGAAYGVGLVLIYLLVVAQFRSYVTPLIIMAPIPLTMIGVMPGHALLGAEFTATSMRAAHAEHGAGTMVHPTTDPASREACTMAQLQDETSRTDLLNRLKRAEGQLRGIQRMIEAGEPCLDIASQMAAVRKALDSAYVRMTVCFMQQELKDRLNLQPDDVAQLDAMLGDMQTLLGKVR